MRTNLFLSLIAMLFLAACTQAPEGQQVEAKEAEVIEDQSTNATETLTVDANASQIRWVATEPSGGGHNGDLKVKSGKLYVEGDVIKGGDFIIDMSSIAVLDLEGGRKAKLESHLKDSDFFEVGKYPEAKFTIAEVNPAENNDQANYIISGNLLMKDSTKRIDFPAQITLADGNLTARTPSFTIDRTAWGVVYRSGLIGTLKDKLIDDQVGLSIVLRAN